MQVQWIASAGASMMNFGNTQPYPHNWAESIQRVLAEFIAGNYDARVSVEHLSGTAAAIAEQLNTLGHVLEFDNWPNVGVS